MHAPLLSGHTAHCCAPSTEATLDTTPSRWIVNLGSCPSASLRFQRRFRLKRLFRSLARCARSHTDMAQKSSVGLHSFAMLHPLHRGRFHSAIRSCTWRASSQKLMPRLRSLSSLRTVVAAGGRRGCTTVSRRSNHTCANDLQQVGASTRVRGRATFGSSPNAPSTRRIGISTGSSARSVTRPTSSCSTCGSTASI